MQLASKKVIDQLVKIIRNLQTYFPDVLYRYAMLYAVLSSSIRPCFLIQSGISYYHPFILIPRKKY